MYPTNPLIHWIEVLTIVPFLIKLVEMQGRLDIPKPLAHCLAFVGYFTIILACFYGSVAILWAVSMIVIVFGRTDILVSLALCAGCTVVLLFI